MDSSWMVNALCKGRDTNDFYIEMTVKGAAEQLRKIKSVCRMCPVIAECLSYAIETNEQFGVWGGFSTKERNKIAKKYGKVSAQSASVLVRKNVNTI